MKRFPIMWVLFCLIFQLSYSTSLSDLAASMKAGEWAELSTNNLVPTLEANGASHAVIGGYHEDLAWDPVTQQILVISGDHNWGENTSQFISYSAATNTWKTEPRPSWLGILHGYDHNAIDVQGRYFYFRTYGSPNFFRYQIDNKVWTTLPSLNVGDYVSCCFGVEYFPEMNGLFVTNTQGGGTYLLGNGANQWNKLGSITPGGYQDFAEYNPVHKVMLFGGSNGSSALYKYDTTGQITPLKDAPRTLGVNQSINTVDPVSGDYLFFFDDATFHTYDITTEKWTQQTGSVPLFSPYRSSPIWHLTATPLSDHGVVLFVKFYFTTPNQAWVYLYKHAEPVGAENSASRDTPNVNPFVSALPNPFSGSVNIRLREEFQGELKIFRPNGQRVARFKGRGPFQWRPETAAPGLYLAEVSTNGRRVVKKIFFTP